MKDKLTMLMILDGFGENKNKDGNADKCKYKNYIYGFSCSGNEGN